MDQVPAFSKVVSTNLAFNSANFADLSTCGSRLEWDASGLLTASRSCESTMVCPFKKKTFQCNFVPKGHHGPQQALCIGMKGNGIYLHPWLSTGECKFAQRIEAISNMRHQN